MPIAHSKKLTKVLVPVGLPGHLEAELCCWDSVALSPSGFYITRTTQPCLYSAEGQTGNLRCFWWLQ